MNQAANRKLAIMFTDLVGYSSMMVANEEQAIKRLAEYRDILFRIIQTHSGKVIDSAGDSVFASFSNLRQAAEAALEIQRSLQQYNKDHADPIQARIGLHYGEVLEKGDIVYGDDVNIAARLESLGDPEGICISEPVYQSLQPQQQRDCVKFGRPELKNIGSNLQVYHLFHGPVSVAKRLQLQFRRLKIYLGTHKFISLALIAAMLLLVMYASATIFSSPPSRDYQVALNKIQNLNPDSLPQYYTIGIEDEIRARIQRIPRVFVSTAEDQGRADVIISGSMQRQTGRVRLTYRIVRADNGVLVGKGSVDGELTDMWTLQGKLVDGIEQALSQQWNLPIASKKTATPNISAQAYQYYLQAREYAKRPDDRKTLAVSISLYKKALDLDDGFAAAYAGLCDAYWGTYLLEKDTGKVDQAEQACLQAQALNAESAEVQTALGEIYRGTGKLTQSIAAFNRAISLEPRNISAYIGLADAYANNDQPDLAEQTYLRAVGLQPGNWKAWVSYGGFNFDRGDFARAETAFRKVVELVPDSVDAYANLGATLLFQGRIKEAAQIFGKQAQLDPSATILSNAATMYYYDGEFEKARELYQKAIRLTPEQCLLWSNLADALHQIPERQNQAIESDRQALIRCNKETEINTDDKIILVIISRLRARLGQMEAARELIDKNDLQHSSDPSVQLYLALTYAHSNQLDAMKNALAQAVKQGYPRFLVKAEPAFAPFRNQHWFESIVQGDQPENQK